MISVRFFAGAGMASLLFLAVTAPSIAAGPAGAAPTGDWLNPAGTVEVSTRPCGHTLCGRVIWASPDAVGDAREGGTPNLVGTELLRDYRAAGPQRWQGTIFVPDLGKSFSSRMRELDPNSLQVSGCLIGGFICKKQIWHRAHGAGAKR